MRSDPCKGKINQSDGTKCYRFFLYNTSIVLTIFARFELIETRKLRSCSSQKAGEQKGYNLVPRWDYFTSTVIFYFPAGKWLEPHSHVGLMNLWTRIQYISRITVTHHTYLRFFKEKVQKTLEKKWKRDTIQFINIKKIEINKLVWLK